MNRSAIHTITSFIVLSAMLLLFGCRDTEPEQQTALTAEMPLHLEEHLDVAHIEGSKVPEDVLKPVEWRFDQPQPDWKPLEPIHSAGFEAVKPVRVEDTLRLPLTTKNRKVLGLMGAIYVKLPDWNIEDWDCVEVRARTRDPMAATIVLAFNYTEEPFDEALFPIYSVGDSARPVADGTIQTYRLSLDKGITRTWQGPWTHLIIGFGSDEGAEAVTLDILSVRVIPKEALHAALKPVEWRFDEPQSDWKPLRPIPEQMEIVRPVRVEDALRLPLIAKNRIIKSRRLFGAIYVELPDWNIEDWAYVEVRARTRDPMPFVGLHFNYTEEQNPHGGSFPSYSRGDTSRPVAGGAIQIYRLSLGERSRDWQGPWTHLIIFCISEKSAEAAMLDILSVRVVPKMAPYHEAPVGVRYVSDRRTIFTHTPGKLKYRLRTPEAGRLDVGLGSFRADGPVDFKITAKPDGGDTVTVLEETYADNKRWAQRRVDLSDFSGEIITLSLEADADRTGTLAFWAKPTVSGKSSKEGPLPSTLIWDTQSPLVDEVDLSDRIDWKVVVDPIGTRYSTFGRGHFFKGDAVVENDHLVAVFRLREGKVVVYSKADLSQKKVEFVPLELKGKSASITNYRILHNTGEDAVLEVSFAGAKAEEEVSALFFFSTKEIVEIKPSENMKGISLLSPIEYGIVPDFLAEDLILNPKAYPLTNTFHIPSSNLFLGLLRGRNNILVVTWPKGEQQMRLMLAGNQEEPRLIESVDFDNDGKSIYLALLNAPGIWHKEELKPSYLERDIAINWKRPFPAKWITQLGKETYRFRGFRGNYGGSSIYPVWFEGETAYYRLGKGRRLEGESLIYFLERRGTPVSVSTPVDIMKEALGRQACETIIDLPGRALRTHHRRPGVTIPGAFVCGFIDSVLYPIFEKGEEVEKKELVEETVDDMAFYVTQVGKRTDEYHEFARDMVEFLKLERTSNPDLRPFLDSMEAITMEAITEDILREDSRRKERIKTSDYIDELTRKTKALTQKKDPKNLSNFSDLVEKWGDMPDAHLDFNWRLRDMIRGLFQEAGYACVNQPEAMEIAEEIRSRCRECLRNPYGLEIWPDY